MTINIEQICRHSHDLHLSKTLFFYHAPFSPFFFHRFILPSLHNSLSLTLQHFPLLPHSLPLSAADFHRLTEIDNFIDAAELDTFLPHSLPAAAVQITLFPNTGICIGLTIHHSIADDSTVHHFIQAWASTNKFNCRRVVNDAGELAVNYCNHTEMPISLSTNVEARFVLTRAMVKTLENFLFCQKKPPAEARDSSFIVASAYLWCFLAMSAAAAGETVADDEPELLAMDLDSGNSSTPVVVESTRGSLKGRGCFVDAAEAITEAMSSERGCRKVLTETAGNRRLVVSGWPRFDAYSVDYGWGRPEMFRCVGMKRVRICRWRDGGVEILMWRARVKMEAFAVVFDRALVEAQDLHLISSL